MAETIRYIQQQPEHHRTRTFQEEYLAFLKKHAMPFDEKYLWN
jgi:REP-associated tyrosine transposase